jgi:EAL domain-containing protein (putative c-di-GMP-specific phosphodiesterase class I)
MDSPRLTSAAHRRSPAPGCDCSSLQAPARFTGGLSLYSHSVHIRRRVPILLGLADIPYNVQGDALWIAPADLHRLSDLLDVLTYVERAALLAAPCPDPQSQSDAWQTARLEDWVLKLQTDWFYPASEHLVFHLQPIMDLRRGTVYGHEALVRAAWQGTLIGAGPLLQAAAAHGQSKAFDAQARRQAIRQVYPHLQPGEILSLNFAPDVVYKPDVCLQTTFQACRDVGADFTQLLFEVTQSEAFPDLCLLQRILERYRALIHALHGSDARVPLILALIRYAHDLGIRVIAEGVETASEFRLIRELGADYAQGFFLARPAPTPAGLSRDCLAAWSAS